MSHPGFAWASAEIRLPGTSILSTRTLGSCLRLAISDIWKGYKRAAILKVTTSERFLSFLAIVRVSYTQTIAVIDKILPLCLL